MRGYLLDTSIASILAPGRSESLRTDLIDWLQAREAVTYLSVMTVMEVESGIQRLAPTAATRRRAELSGWLMGLFATFGDRILPVDGRVAMAAGRLEATIITKGHNPGLADILIAATGAVHQLTVLTRNLRHFQPLEVPCLDPLKELL